MPERERRTPHLDAFAYRHTWPFVAVPSLVVGLLMLFDCASRDWHAPRVSTIVVILTGAMVMGAVVARAYFALRSEHDRQHLGESVVVRTKSANRATLAMSLIATAALVGVSAPVLYQLLGGVERVLASFVAALFTAAIPVVATAMHAVFARPVWIGLDAVAVGRRIVRFADLAQVGTEGRTLSLVLVSGETVSAHLANEHLARALSDRIFARAKPTHHAPPALHRAGRPLREWQGALTAAGYRDDHVSIEEAARVLGAARASVDERIGAAIVLAHAKHGEQVRIAAAECIEPRVRVALERAADETLDDEALEAIARAR